MGPREVVCEMVLGGLLHRWRMTEMSPTVMLSRHGCLGDPEQQRAKSEALASEFTGTDTQ